MIDAVTAIKNAIGWLQEAIRLLEPAVSQATETSPVRQIAWGKKVSSTFRERVLWIADDLGCNPDYLMACMAWESAETFRPDIKNAAGSGATGLIQFMPSTAKGLGTTTAELAEMTSEDQLRFVYKYFEPYRGRLNNLGDVYMGVHGYPLAQGCR
jgi:soluble lytic murein transglycosylase-like protein